MRIIGGHDYYDSALSYGHDAHTVFVRGTDTIGVEDARAIGIEPPTFRPNIVPVGVPGLYYVDRRPRPVYRPVEYPVDLRGQDYRLRALAAIVCGTRYEGVRISPVSGNAPSWTFWSKDKFMKFLAEYDLEVRTRIEELDEHFVPRKVLPAVLQHLIDRRITLMVYNPVSEGADYHPQATPWQINQDCMKNIEFFRVMEPNLLFQEIDMWVGGVLTAPAREVAEVSDDVRAAKHGMDKTSFRKPKSKKRKR